MEFPEYSEDGCPYGAHQLLSEIDKQIEKLKNTDVESFRRDIEKAPEIKTKSKYVEELLGKNIPAGLDLLNNLLKEHRNDTLLYLELMSHRLHVAMCMESFTRARTLAEEAHAMAKDLYQSLEKGSMDTKLSSNPTYKAYINSCVDLIIVCRYQGNIDDAEVYLEEANTVADVEDEDVQQLLLIHKGNLLLARNEPKDAIETIFIPLLSKPQISLKSKGVLLNILGIAYRSTASWDLAKKCLRDSIEIAKDLKDCKSEHDGAACLGSVYQLEGRIEDALKQMIPHMVFAFKRGDLLGLTLACYNMSQAYCALNSKPDLERAQALLCLYSRLAYRMGRETRVVPMLASRVSQILVDVAIDEGTGSAGQSLRTLKCEHTFDEKKISGSVDCERFICVKQYIRNERIVSAGQTPTHSNVFFLKNEICCDRSTGKYDEVIEGHNKHLLNATEREDYFSAAHFQTELAIDYVCKGDFDNAEKQARDAILTLESIRSKLGEEDASKIANFDKNQSEAYNLLQIILCRQEKHSEALALSELARSRALTDLIRDKLMKTSGAQTESWIYSSDCVSRWQELKGDILLDFRESADELNTNFVVYSVVKDLEINGSAQPWLYIWLVLNENSANGGDRIRFEKRILNEGVFGELEDNIFFSSLRRSLRILAERDNILAKKKDKDIESQSKEKTIRVEIPEGREVEEFLQLLESLPLRNMEPTSSTTKETRGEQVLTRDIVQHSENLEAGTKEREPEDNTTDIELKRVMECGSWDTEGINRLLQLYEVCIAPINDYLPETKDGIVPSITIIPHDFLFSVPFCCLHNGNSEYFVERFVLNYAPSLQALLLLNQRLKHLKCEQGDRNLKLLAMGNPTMVLPGIQDLPCSGDEAKQVQEVFDPELSQLVTRSDATKRLLLRELKNIDILHVATHATSQNIKVDDKESQGDYSMRGSLLLASSDEEDCEGEVFASEIAAVDSTCQLVTLSCCETGLGKVTGDGVLGLYRAFLAAGTASLLVTLWKIRDDITPLFMKRFYAEFKATGNVSGSLRSAMLYCIQEEKLPPQHWAAFSLIGAISS